VAPAALQTDLAQTLSLSVPATAGALSTAAVANCGKVVVDGTDPRL